MTSWYGNTPRFIPERLNGTAVRPGHVLARAVARLRYGVHVQIAPGDHARFERLAGTRFILLANHPTPPMADLLLISATLPFPFIT
jgi:hypothetical protein